MKNDWPGLLREIWRQRHRMPADLRRQCLLSGLISLLLTGLAVWLLVRRLFGW